MEMLRRKLVARWKFRLLSLSFHATFPQCSKCIFSILNFWSHHSNSSFAEEVGGSQSVSIYLGFPLSFTILPPPIILPFAPPPLTFLYLLLILCIRFSLFFAFITWCPCLFLSALSPRLMDRRAMLDRKKFLSANDPFVFTAHFTCGIKFAPESPHSPLKKIVLRSLPFYSSSLWYF